MDLSEEDPPSPETGWMVATVPRRPLFILPLDAAAIAEDSASTRKPHREPIHAVWPQCVSTPGKVQLATR